MPALWWESVSYYPDGWLGWRLGAHQEQWPTKSRGPCNLGRGGCRWAQTTRSLWGLPWFNTTVGGAVINYSLERDVIRQSSFRVGGSATCPTPCLRYLWCRNLCLIYSYDTADSFSVSKRRLKLSCCRRLFNIHRPTSTFCSIVRICIVDYRMLGTGYLKPTQ